MKALAKAFMVVTAVSVFYVVYLSADYLITLYSTVGGYDSSDLLLTLVVLLVFHKIFETISESKSNGETS